MKNTPSEQNLFGPETPGYARLNELIRAGKLTRAAELRNDRSAKKPKRVKTSKVPESQGNEKTP
jgi:hypothetical protein